MIDDEKMKVGDEVAFHWGDEVPDTVIVITHWDGYERCVVCVKESAEMDENRKAFSTCSPVVKADGGREMNDDTISRQAAIDALESIGSIDTEADKEYARSVFEALPSAQPEIIKCKECKHWFDIDDGRQKHRMCADICGDWFCADAERRTDDER